MINEPKYDEDVVTLGYLNKKLSKTDADTDEKLTDYSKVYIDVPTVPYYKGSTWINNDNIYTAIRDRLIGTFVASDWVTETGAKAIATSAQMNNRIFTSLPDDYKANDMWILQSDTDHASGKKGEVLISLRENAEYHSEDWISKIEYASKSLLNQKVEDLNADIEIAQSNNKIFTSQPSNYKANDMWILQSDTDHPNEKSGEILISINANSIYRANDWISQIEYASKALLNEKVDDLNAGIESVLTIARSKATLQEAQQEAQSLIDTFNSGYWIKHNGTQYLCDNQNIQNANNVWVFGVGGIAHSGNGINGEYDVAITMDGKIVADMITSGVMSADRIKGGTLILGGTDNTNGRMQVKDANGSLMVDISHSGIVLANGTQLVGANGVLSLIQVDTGEYKKTGFQEMFYNWIYSDLEMVVHIPSNFVIKSAYIVLSHSPILYQLSSGKSWAYSRDLKLYKCKDENYFCSGNYPGEEFRSEDSEKTEIVNAFGSTSWTPDVPVSTSAITNVVDEVSSVDIKNSLEVGKNNRLKIRTGLAVPTYIEDPDGYGDPTNIVKTGKCKAVLNIIGYTK